METYKIQKKRAEHMVALLLDWYDENKRDLPWRQSQHPYNIWVSEIMAQQTRIEALIPFYRRFMEQFPTAQSLACAQSDAVLKAWEGLGYYSRARNLQKSARIVVNQYGGQMPGTYKELIALPGIGDYTAGAILSIAFGQPVPAVDGNVLRVFSRVENSTLDVAAPAAKEITRQFVSRLMPPGRTSCFTQALMELGALICIPKKPLCQNCPVVEECKAYQKGTQQQLPVKSPKKPVKHVEKTLIIALNPEGKVLVRQRTEKLLNSLWEFYLADTTENEQPGHHLMRLGLTAGEFTPIGQVTHVFTHMVWHMSGFYCTVDEVPAPDGYCFLTPSELHALAMPTAIRFYSDWLRLFTSDRY